MRTSLYRKIWPVLLAIWQTTPAPDVASVARVVLAPSHRSNPALAPEERFWRPFPFLKDQTKLNPSIWNKTVTWTISDNFCFILFPRLLINIIFLALQKTGAKTAPRVPKLSYLDGRVPKVSSQVTLTQSWADVVCHIRRSSIFRKDKFEARTRCKVQILWRSKKQMIKVLNMDDHRP